MSHPDRYTYPGTDVLINHMGITNADDLDRALNLHTSVAWAEIIGEPAPQTPDFEALRTIHERLFGRVLPFAGRLRDTDVGAGGTGIAYCRPIYIEQELRAFYERLGREDYLRGLGTSMFAARLAERWGDLTAIHPFRDGNTRSQSLYVTLLARRAGHALLWERIDVDKLRFLRLNAMAGSERGLADYLRERIAPYSE